MQATDIDKIKNHFSSNQNMSLFKNYNYLDRFKTERFKVLVLSCILCLNEFLEPGNFFSPEQK